LTKKSKNNALLTNFLNTVTFNSRRIPDKRPVTSNAVDPEQQRRRRHLSDMQEMC